MNSSSDLVTHNIKLIYVSIQSSLNFKEILKCFAFDPNIFLFKFLITFSQFSYHQNQKKENSISLNNKKL